jgi:hypothetical protein
MDYAGVITVAIEIGGVDLSDIIASLALIATGLNLHAWISSN